MPARLVDARNDYFLPPLLFCSPAAALPKPHSQPQQEAGGRHVGSHPRLRSTRRSVDRYQSEDFRAATPFWRRLQNKPAQACSSSDSDFVSVHAVGCTQAPSMPGHAPREGGAGLGRGRTAAPAGWGGRAGVYARQPPFAPP